MLPPGGQNLPLISNSLNIFLISSAFVRKLNSDQLNAAEGDSLLLFYCKSATGLVRMLLVSELQREAETPGERVPSVCCAVSVTQWCRVSSKRNPVLPQHLSPTPSPPTVLADSAPGSDADHLLNDRSVCLSSVYESIPRSPSSPSLLSVLPGNR